MGNVCRTASLSCDSINSNPYQTLLLHLENWEILFLKLDFTVSPTLLFFRNLMFFFFSLQQLHAMWPSDSSAFWSHFSFSLSFVSSVPLNSLFVFMRSTTHIVILKNSSTVKSTFSLQQRFLTVRLWLFTHRQECFCTFLIGAIPALSQFFPLPCCNYRRFSKPKITLKHSSLPYFSQNAT